MNTSGRVASMSKREMVKWQKESVEQAYAELENDVMAQYSGFVTFAHPKEN